MRHLPTGRFERRYCGLQLRVTTRQRGNVSTACGSGRVMGEQTRPLPQAVLTLEMRRRPLTCRMEVQRAGGAWSIDA